MSGYSASVCWTLLLSLPPLPFLFFGDTPKTLQIWAKCTVLLVNLNTLLLTGSFLCIHLRYLSLLAFFGLMHGLSGVLSYIINNPADNTWYIVYILCLAALSATIHFLIALFMGCYFVGIGFAGQSLEEKRRIIRCDLTYFQLLIAGSSTYFLIRLLEQNLSTRAWWNWASYWYIIVFWCGFLWLVEIFRNRIAIDSFELHRRKVWTIYTFYMLIVVPGAGYLLWMGLTAIFNGVCSPYMINLQIYLIMIIGPAILFSFIILMALVIRSCCKIDLWDIGSTDEPLSPSQGSYLSMEEWDLEAVSRCYIETDAQEGMEEEQCSICWDNFKKEQQLVKVVQCQHIFHRGCLSQWTLKNETCPVCRMKIAKLPLLQIS